MALQPGQRPPRGVAEVRPSCPNQRRKMITIRITRAVIEFTSTAGRGDESGLAVKALLPVLEGRLQRKPGRLPALPADHGRKRRKAPLMKKTTEATMSPSPSDRRPAPAATVVNRSTRQRNPQSLRPKDGPAMQSLNAITIVGLRVRGRCVRSLSLSLCPPPPPSHPLPSPPLLTVEMEGTSRRQKQRARFFTPAAFARPAFAGHTRANAPPHLRLLRRNAPL